MAVMRGRVWAGAVLRKLQTQAIDAFGSADALPLGEVRQGEVVMRAAWPTSGPGLRVGLADALPEAGWPRVEIVVSHAGADGRLVDLLVADGVRGLLVAGTGNGSVHQALEAALLRAEVAGVRVVRASRVGRGLVTGRGPEHWACAKDLSPAQARVALMLRLLDERAP
jgi:L-asparaginase